MGAATRDIVAAGAVVLRSTKGPAKGSAKRSGREVLLVHRPKYDDWSFPKGKLDRREHATAAAVREVEEETGVAIRLARPLKDQRYRAGRGWKRVHYWIGRVRDGAADDVTGYERPGEIDEAAWVPVEEAPGLLSYPHDRATLREALAARKKSSPVIVLRHADARSRDTWRGEDADRPLLADGRRQSDGVAAVLAAYGVARVVTSTSLRCRQTVEPYAVAAGVPVEATALLSEERAAGEETDALVTALVEELPDAGPLVLCSHRPVLPVLFGALGVRPLGLAKGELAVVHLRKGKVVAIERHLPL